MYNIILLCTQETCQYSLECTEKSTSSYVMVLDFVPLDIRHEFIGEGAPVEVREVSLL